MPGKRWTSDEIAMLDAMYADTDTRAVAEAVGRSVTCVQKMAGSRGLKKSAEFLSTLRRSQPISEAAKSKWFKKKHGLATLKNDGEVDPTYGSWLSMQQRCNNSGHKSYSRYGGRGITVCERWRDFLNFREDMGERPAGMTLGRIDNDGNYEPGNCRWETAQQQMRNRRGNRFVTAFGATRTIAEWSEVFGVSHDTISYRLRAGWDAVRAVSCPALGASRG